MAELVSEKAIQEPTHLAFLGDPGIREDLRQHFLFFNAHARDFDLHRITPSRADLHDVKARYPLLFIGDTLDDDRLNILIGINEGRVARFDDDALIGDAHRSKRGIGCITGPIFRFDRQGRSAGPARWAKEDLFTFFQFGHM